MSRLADPDELPLSDSKMAPPVRIRRNITSSGRGMKVETLNLAKDQIKSETAVSQPTFTHTPPTPDLFNLQVSEYTCPGKFIGV